MTGGEVKVVGRVALPGRAIREQGLVAQRIGAIEQPRAQRVGVEQILALTRRGLHMLSADPQIEVVVVLQ